MKSSKVSIMLHFSPIAQHYLYFFSYSRVINFIYRSRHSHITYVGQHTRDSNIRYSSAPAASKHGLTVDGCH
jgi:hypothetical protein